MYFLRLVVSGDILFKEVTPVASGETEVSLSQPALLSGIQTQILLLETKTEADTRQSALIAEIDVNETKIDTLTTNVSAIPTTDSVADLAPVLTAIGNLNDFDPATDQVIVATNNDKTDYELANNAITSNKVANNAFNNSAFTTGYFNSINSEVDTALADYDGPTKAELDAAEASILSAIGAGAITAQDVWDYLQSNTTISGSMKEALEIALKNSKLIPAAL